jgi:alpha-galactosidase
MTTRHTRAHTYSLLSHSHLLLVGQVGSGKPWAWAPDVGHYWRTGPDLGTRWGDDTSMSIMLNYDLQQAIPSLDSLSGPGSFAFLDNLAVGLPPNVPHKGDTGLTLDEAHTHFSIW